MTLQDTDAVVGVVIAQATALYNEVAWMHQPLLG
jgi:hypothetical protein